MLKRVLCFVTGLAMLFVTCSCSKKDDKNTESDSKSHVVNDSNSLYSDDEAGNPQNNENEVQIDFASKIEPHYTNFMVPVEPVTEVPEGYIGIYSPEDLDNIRYNSKANYILMCDIDMNDFGTFDTIESFEGVFDGNGHKISRIKSYGLAVYSPYVGPRVLSVGLFCHAAEIKNLGIENIILDISNLDEIDIGEKTGLANVEGGDINLRISALAAYSKTISNCYATGSIRISDLNYPIEQLTVGSVVGEAVYASDCYSNCSVEVLGVDYDTLVAGGVVGSGFEISHCYNASDITANCVVKEFDRFYNFNNGATANLGGIAGTLSTKATECRNSGSVFAQKSEKYNSVSCGGIIGKSDGFVEKSYNSGDIQAQSASTGETLCAAGGIVGSGCTYNMGSSYYVNRCYNTGYIVSIAVGDSCSGGIIGAFLKAESVFDCFNVGSISAESEQGNAQSGGITGDNTGEVYRCYNIGLVSGNGANVLKGAICGNFSANIASVENCYYSNENISAVGTKAMFSDVKYLSKKEFSDISKLKDFNFGTDNEVGIWGYNSSIEYNYPVLIDVYFEIVN